ncbi:Aminopeptidase P1 isoform A [Glycine soja]|uniref:Aminopeptidase P1 isoform A n=1 Tax=Glycine soja TaxID=3848 RepID=A0A445HXV5_GLYSO|nr:Aminopeptidase P1 isoform A [Glycine soja]
MEHATRGTARRTRQQQGSAPDAGVSGSALLLGATGSAQRVGATGAWVVPASGALPVAPSGRALPDVPVSGALPCCCLVRRAVPRVALMSWSCPLKIITGVNMCLHETGAANSFPASLEAVASISLRFLFVFVFSFFFKWNSGLALIRKNEALLWMDGRYFFQAGQELSAEWKLMRIGEDPAVDIWMADKELTEFVLAIAPTCQKKHPLGLTLGAFRLILLKDGRCAFAKRHQKLVQTTKDLVDEVWINCLLAEINAVIVHPLNFAGRSVADKLKDVRKKPVQEQAQDSIFSFFRMVYSYLKEVHNKFFQNGLFVPLLEVFQKCLGIIFTAIDEVAWLYNIRGSDVAYCSIVHAFSIVASNSAFIYVDMRKVSVEYTAVSSDVTLLATDELDTVSTAKVDLAETEVRKITSETDKSVNGEHKAEENSNDLVWADPKKCCYALYAKLNPDKVLLQQSPLALAKALKNSVELDGLKKAHIRDGAAVVQYLVWLDKKMQDIYGASGYFLEKDSVKKEKHFWKAITQLANHGMLFVPAGKLLSIWL